MSRAALSGCGSTRCRPAGQAGRAACSTCASARRRAANAGADPLEADAADRRRTEGKRPDDTCSMNCRAEKAPVGEGPQHPKLSRGRGVRSALMTASRGAPIAGRFPLMAPMVHAQGPRGSGAGRQGFHAWTMQSDRTLERRRPVAADHGPLPGAVRAGGLAGLCRGSAATPVMWTALPGPDHDTRATPTASP